MINSGTESSRPPQRGAPPIRLKPFLSPSTPRLSTPRGKAGGLLSPRGKSCGWARATLGAGGDKRERWPRRALGPCPHPTQAASAVAACSGYGHRPRPRLWVCGWDGPPKAPGMCGGDGTARPGLGSPQLPPTRGSTPETQGVLQLPPALNFRGRSCPLPPVRSPGSHTLQLGLISCVCKKRGFERKKSL